MNLNDYLDAEHNQVLEYVVYNDNTLGYLFLCDSGFQMGVFAGSVLKGGRDWQDGPAMVFESDILRKATKQDFDQYCVCWEEHLS